MSAPIAGDPSQWFDGLRPEAPWKLQEPGPVKDAPAPPPLPARVDSYGKVPAAPFGAGMYGFPPAPGEEDQD